MVTREEIMEQFESYGMKIEDEVITKCLELCEAHHIEEAVVFVEHWLAFSLSKLNGAKPTVQKLTEMEKSVYFVNDYSNDGGSLLSVCDRSKHSPQKTYSGTTPGISDVSYRHIISGMKSPFKSPPKNSEKIVCTFGHAGLGKETKWSSSKRQNIIVKEILGEKLYPHTKYMFDSINGKCQLLRVNLLVMGKEFSQKIYDDDSSGYNWQNVDTPNQDSFKAIGRIASDGDTKLTFASTLLVDSDETAYRTAHLNFSKIDSFAVYPGQVVMVFGKNPRGDTIYVEEIKSERLLKQPTTPNLENPINFVISAGPYTCESDLAYNPLQNLLNYCKRNTPDVIILCGPFIEADHTLIMKNTLPESFEAFFEKIWHQFTDTLGCQTVICIVPSAKDAISPSVYPTCPITLQKSPKNVHLLSDPCILDINSVLVGVTSIDVLNHIAQEELASKAGDRVKRGVNYLFQQKSFYPLNPPPLNSNIDSELLQQFARLDIIPNIIILPSDLKYFIREVHSCLAINPGRIMDTKGGTFARLTISPSKGNCKSFEFMACQILKL